MNCIKNEHIKNERIKNEIIKNERIKNERIKNELIKKRTDPWVGIELEEEEAVPNTTGTDEEIGQKQISSPLSGGV